MTVKAKPDLSLQSVTELISEVSASDRQKARLAIAKGVQAAQDQWIEAPLIAEALSVELVNVARHSVPGAQIAAYLRELAEHLEAQKDVH